MMDPIIHKYINFDTLFKNINVSSNLFDSINFSRINQITSIVDKKLNIEHTIEYENILNFMSNAEKIIREYEKKNKIYMSKYSTYKKINGINIEVNYIQFDCGNQIYLVYLDCGCEIILYGLINENSHNFLFLGNYEYKSHPFYCTDKTIFADTNGNKSNFSIEKEDMINWTEIYFDIEYFFKKYA